MNDLHTWNHRPLLEGCDGKQCVFENGRFFTSDVTQRTQKNRFFLNDVTKDTDAHKKYSLLTSLVGKQLPKLMHEIP